MGQESDGQWRSDGSVAAIYGATAGEVLRRPLFACGVSAGFPSPADDHIERQLDLNELLIRNPPATFFVRAAGDSMIGAGINHDDILVVDRSLEPVSGRIVIAVLDGELTVKRLLRRDNSWLLLPENPAYPPRKIGGESSFEVWGVVTSVIHQF